MKKKCGLSNQRSVPVTLVIATCSCTACVSRCLELHIVDQSFDPEMVGLNESDCSSCVTAILAHFPNLKRKLKVHLLLLLSESMLQFGPTTAYSTER